MKAILVTFLGITFAACSTTPTTDAQKNIISESEVIAAQQEGALSYFVGGNPNFPDDKGFALAGWEKCEVDNAAINKSGDSATSLGKVHFTNKNGEMTTVDKTWKFVKDNAGKLRIVVHHSSLENKAK